MEEKTHYFAGIASGLLGSIIFGLVYALVTILTAVIFEYLQAFPLLWIVTILCASDSGGPSLLVYTIGAAVAVLAVIKILEEIAKNENTFELSAKTTGVLIIAVNVIFAIINLLGGSAIVSNVFCVIAGLAVFHAAG